MENNNTGVTSVKELSASEKLALQKQQLAEAQAKVKEMQKALFEQKQQIAEPTVGKTGRVIIRLPGQRYPLSLHKNQWEYLRNNMDNIIAFCETHKDTLKATNEAYKASGGKDDNEAA